jgi:hypothetical protein
LGGRPKQPTNFRAARNWWTIFDVTLILVHRRAAPALKDDSAVGPVLMAVLSEVKLHCVGDMGGKYGMHVIEIDGR